MEPKPRDIIGATLLFVILVALVVYIVATTAPTLA